ncbi:MAG: AlpA family phage regulatory protein [Candidatus Sericytochromatia bacterium]|nr:AlpA family phage regulatory protein [Candidatus Tanganyikabacteria bacterium]
MPTTAPQTSRVIRWPEVRELTGLSRTSVWRAERAGDFPARIRLTPGSCGWLETEVLAWVASRRRGMA